MRVAFGGPAASGLFVAPIASSPELQFYRARGLDVVDGHEDARTMERLLATVRAADDTVV